MRSKVHIEVLGMKTKKVFNLHFNCIACAKKISLLTFLFSFFHVQINAEELSNRPEQSPNIIFIMADDLGWQDVGFTGSKWFETPNLDNLASQSLVFNNAYMYPTCSPSRAALMTGQHSFRTGVYMVPVLEKGTAENNIYSRWTVTHENPMYSEFLSKDGYKLSHIGKWHLVGPYPDKEQQYPFETPLKQPANGDFSWLPAHLTAKIQQFYPIGRGFDENIGGSFWGDPARGYPQGYRSESGGYRAPFNNPFIQTKDSDEWLTDRLTDEAIDFISRHKKRPFFINLNYYSPHRPTVSRSEDSLQHFLDKPGDPQTGQGDTDNIKKKTNIAAYATMIKSIDQNVERLIKYLDENNLRENTIIIFTSDNGFNSFQSVNKNLRGQKGSFYEGGIRVPMFINWPNFVKPGETDMPVSGLDYFPTFMELANIDAAGLVLDGDSLVPLLSGNKMPERSIIWHLASEYKNKPATVIRRGEWKLIQYLLTDEVELYNLDKDMYETNDLSSSNPKIVNKLVKELAQWRQQNHVPVPPNAVVDSPEQPQSLR
ncbi:sulfatase [Aliiglaciecola lipolytica]|uniref:Predicted sulfatase n=1 Tax=Aliiglaciecola lipolytica E3 TaxID=1127673 RepID=K6YP38_9ALTE|nr:sulfatase [Aliiglaciecola lipolytica]GAC13110.1 predicted sulfatase [Aliiglaciecola lipolytica E3]